MSRKSDNSKGGSQGNGDSVLSSYQNSPRKTPEFPSAGPFGDHCTETKPPDCYILMMNNDSSSESEDQQACDLKAEYLERLNLIRQKLASIDIANYGSYYKNCSDYSRVYSPTCQITEIFDESPEDAENINNLNTVIKVSDVKSGSSKQLVNSESENRNTPQKIEFEHENSNNISATINSKEANSLSNVLPAKDQNITDCKANSNFLQNKKHIAYIDSSSTKKILPVEERNVNDSRIVCDDLKDKNPKLKKKLNCNEDSKNSHVKKLLPEKKSDIDDSERECIFLENKKQFAYGNMDINGNPYKNPTSTKSIFLEDETVIDISEIKSELVENKDKITDKNNDPQNTSLLAKMLKVEDQYIERSTKECNVDFEKKGSKDFELKTIFKSYNPYDVESTVDIIDLNYNPPKKKPCVREKTPKIIMSEGAMSLPYHIRISLHSATLRAIDPDKLKKIELLNVVNDHTITKDYIEHIPGDGNNICEEKNNHIFPEVQVDRVGGGDQEDTTNWVSNKMTTLMDKEVVDSPRKSAVADNEYNVFFFETVEQSPSESLKSAKTVITETTVTTESPSRKPKRRKLLLRSAQNKVKPMDTISLWEEIRTIEALNKLKRDDSSSSLESYFKDIIMCKKKSEPEIEISTVESTNIPPQTKPPSRLPSFTRLTKFCSSIFKKKSQTIIEETTDETGEAILNSNQDVKNLNQNATNLKQNEENSPGIKENVAHIPKAAHMLLNVRKEQEIDVDIGNKTPTGENYSDHTSIPEEDDSYYEGFCRICFCF